MPVSKTGAGGRAAGEKGKWLPEILDDGWVLVEDSVQSSKGNCSCSSVSLQPEKRFYSFGCVVVTPMDAKWKVTVGLNASTAYSLNTEIIILHYGAIESFPKMTKINNKVLFWNLSRNPQTDRHTFGDGFVWWLLLSLVFVKRHGHCSNCHLGDRKEVANERNFKI